MKDELYSSKIITKTLRHNFCVEIKKSFQPIGSKTTISQVPSLAVPDIGTAFFFSIFLI
jgi:hypothetical protein